MKQQKTLWEIMKELDHLDLFFILTVWAIIVLAICFMIGISIWWVI